MTTTRKISISLIVFGIAIALTYIANPEPYLIQAGDHASEKGHSQQAFESYKRAALLYPFSPTSHQRLALLFSQANDWEKARQELLVAIDLSKNKSDLRMQLQQVNLEIAKPIEVAKQITHWEQVVQEKPDYRDAWIHLSLLYYQSYNSPKAHDALAKAEAIDPNNQTIAKLQQLYSQR